MAMHHSYKQLYIIGQQHNEGKSRPASASTVVSEYTLHVLYIPLHALFTSKSSYCQNSWYSHNQNRSDMSMHQRVLTGLWTAIL